MKFFHLLENGDQKVRLILVLTSQNREKHFKMYLCPQKKKITDHYNLCSQRW